MSHTIGSTRSSSRLAGTQLSTFQATCAPSVLHAVHNIMLPFPSNALERSSAQALGLISGCFPWIMSSGIICQVSPKIALDNSRFDDIVLAERFKIHWRKHLVFVLHSFDSNMKRFWDHVSLSAVFVVVVIFSNCLLTQRQDLCWYC